MFVLDPADVAFFQAEVADYQHPIYDEETYKHVSTWKSATESSLQRACVRLDGTELGREDWREVTKTRKAVVTKLLDFGKSDGKQDRDLYELAIKVLEKRHPVLSYCAGAEYDAEGRVTLEGSWKARSFIKGLIDDMRKKTRAPRKGQNKGDDGGNNNHNEDDDEREGSQQYQGPPRKRSLPPRSEGGGENGNGKRAKKDDEQDGQFEREEVGEQDNSRDIPVDGRGSTSN